MGWVERLFTGRRKSTVSQNPEKIVQREVTDRLIDEHRRANTEALGRLKREVPASSTRYLTTMDQAMTIMKGGR